jgi:hypothetical protein
MTRIKIIKFLYNIFFFIILNGLSEHKSYMTIFTTNSKINSPLLSKNPAKLNVANNMFLWVLNGLFGFEGLV